MRTTHKLGLGFILVLALQFLMQNDGFFAQSGKLLTFTIVGFIANAATISAFLVAILEMGAIEKLLARIRLQARLQVAAPALKKLKKFVHDNKPVAEIKRECGAIREFIRFTKELDKDRFERLSNLLKSVESGADEVTVRSDARDLVATLETIIEERTKWLT